MTDTLNPYSRSHVQEMHAFRTMKRLEEQGVIAAPDSFLVVFGGDFDFALFDTLDYRNVELSSIGAGEITQINGHDSSRMLLDACDLPYEDGSYDHVFAHAGIHHASRPHQAVCEMYRVASKSVIFFEAQDSLAMRALAHLNLISTYEWNAIVDSGYQRGGVDDSTVPNYVYRWTPREIEKLVRSLDPAHVPQIEVFREWSLYYRRFSRRLRSTPLRLLPTPLLEMGFKIADTVVNSVARAQGNMFGICINKNPSGLQPWLRTKADKVFLDPEIGLQPFGWTARSFTTLQRVRHCEEGARDRS